MFDIANVNSTLVDFDPVSGLSRTRKSLVRRLSHMKAIFHDRAAVDRTLQGEDPVIYEFYDMGMPETSGDVAFGTSIAYPGKIGDEYHMTKGHFHTVLDTAEVYYCLQGHGLMMMESPEGAVEVQELRKGMAVYVPGRYAHRSINISAEDPLVTFFAFPGHAGHDYGTIETKGFRKLVVERGGAPALIDNPLWIK
ncbi:glucose-6-phosphate isomerase [Roseiarcus fermentans]|uniref:glucose-6-phosphate isomerase n=1 Tax=Roseiarcus fermentans TaxID=1473586 RepID=A0A366FWP2_9HYPH|nr:glucose-6-phosphate isomerase family protein [Roseiarcus fermentans]RBP18119.1 glucose-6-phosphate isomerase [Roseiarcus fermentans]